MRQDLAKTRCRPGGLLSRGCARQRGYKYQYKGEGDCGSAHQEYDFAKKIGFHKLVALNQFGFAHNPSVPTLESQKGRFHPQY
jgi:hypothetical protein